MQRIEIYNFGPIKEVKLEIKDFMVFVGPQASGKSTIAKSIFFFRSLKDDLVNYFFSASDQNNLSNPLEEYSKIIKQRFLDYFGTSRHLLDFGFKYYYSEQVWINIYLPRGSSFINPQFSIYFKEIVIQLAQDVQSFHHTITSKDFALLTSNELLQIENKKNEFKSQITKQCNTLFGDDKELIFIPAGRSLLATLADQLHYIEPSKLDSLMRIFVTKINLLRPIFNKSLDEIIKARKILTLSEIDMNRTKLAAEIIGKILKGKYQFDKDGEKIYLDNAKEFVRLNFASSGQQEALWILLLLFIVILEQQNVFIVIEEPEAHLFPEAQKEIVALIALLSNMKQSQVIITTHSPYILASVNNLILANKVGKKHPDIVSSRINKHLWLHRDKIFAAMVQSGAVTEIVDPEFDIIQQESIDTISQVINDEFDYLYQYDTANDNA